jgi:hypothetical protein
MPSPAASKFHRSAARARVLREVMRDPRLRPLSQVGAQSFAHASLATLVAAWDAYLNELVKNFYSEIADPARPSYLSIHTIAFKASEEAIRRFNTPNFENARKFLVATTGYDPYSDWVWPRRGMNVQLVKERLNEIIRVRHSFAHGFSIPSYSWTTSPSGRVRLTITVLRDTERFFGNLVNRTDKRMKEHIWRMYTRRPVW